MHFFYLTLEFKNGKLKRMPNTADTYSFNGKTNANKEMELVRRLPKIIKQLKNRELGHIDLKRLSKTYGALWPLMVEEASRESKTEMNPIIEILLNASKLRNIKIDGDSEKFGNDIECNTVNLRKYFISHRGRIPLRLLKLRMKTNLTPAQRLLKVVAVLVSESITNRLSET